MTDRAIVIALSRNASIVEPTTLEAIGSHRIALEAWTADTAALSVIDRDGECRFVMSALRPIGPPANDSRITLAEAVRFVNETLKPKKAA